MPTRSDRARQVAGGTDRVQHRITPPPLFSADQSHDALNDGIRLSLRPAPPLSFGMAWDRDDLEAIDLLFRESGRLVSRSREVQRSAIDLSAQPPSSPYAVRGTT